MTEITRVPLPPVARGSVGKLWLGVAALALAGGGLAWAAMPEAVRVETIREGNGAMPAPEDVAIINYVGKLENGRMFDEGREAPMPLGQVVPGFRDGITRMKVGGSYRLRIPAAKAYGAKEQRNPETGEVVIPANSNLVFEIDLLQAMPRAQFEQMLQMQQMMQMQQMQQMRRGRPGGPGEPGDPREPAPPGA